MSKKLTVTLSDEIYERLCKEVGRREIGRFMDALVRERLTDRHSADRWLGASEEELGAAYQEQAAYEASQKDE